MQQKKIKFLRPYFGAGGKSSLSPGYKGAKAILGVSVKKTFIFTIFADIMS